MGYQLLAIFTNWEIFLTVVSIGCPRVWFNHVHATWSSTYSVVSSPQAAELFLKTHDDVFASRPNAQAAECLAYGNKGWHFRVMVRIGVTFVKYIFRASY
ncbi:hypothetical protein GIB67_030139 [Kingdonia uniflora]|uniref:Uncharacterized protein n=1 Tax=Kingdonia uniflora TaxID=39325 RepID=A0A7J7L6W8_9MAGN|nr:hypothetical protein GIB67_030139 [Kingdonia uniflora]